MRLFGRNKRNCIAGVYKEQLKVIPGSNIRLQTGIETIRFILTGNDLMIRSNGKRHALLYASQIAFFLRWGKRAWRASEKPISGSNKEFQYDRI